MMFLLKAAFWLGLVLILLPTGSKKHDTPEIKAAEAASAATAAVSDLSQFCARQPESCSVGSQVASILAHRAQDGAIMVYEFITERREAGKDKDASKKPDAIADGRGAERPDTTGSILKTSTGGHALMLPRPRPDRSHDTLTADDRQPAWRKPAVTREAQLRQPI
jgi:hypothetical protein